MAGPWEKFQKSESAGSQGPWTRFQAQAKVEPEAPKGQQVYDAPIGPAPEGVKSVGEFVDRAKVLATQGKQAVFPQGTYPNQYPIEGAAPLAIPAGAIPKIAALATQLAEGQGLGFAAGRTALSAGQGAVQAALDGKEGESWQDKVDRAESGAKLSGGIQAAAEAIPYVGKALGYGARKLGAAISGVDENLIANYAKRTDEVNDLIKKSGGDITQAADTVRNELSTGIQNTKRGLNAKISQTLESASPERNIFIQPILDKLEAAKAKLNPNFKSGAIAEIDDMIASISREAVDGQVNAKSLYEIKQFLNEGSASAYNKGGQIFTRAGEAARAAKDAAAEARDTLRPFVGAVSEADSQLSRLHRIERDLNRNLLAAGKPDAALIAAGSGANARNAGKLAVLERVSGVPVTQRAQDLATAKAFANPAILPTDYTGKAVARQAGSALLGTAIGGPVGGAIGGALASPMAVKLGVNAANVARQVASKIPGSGLPEAIRRNPIAATAATQLAASQIRKANEPQVPTQEPPKLLDVPKTGPERWARTGLERLGITDPTEAERLLSSKETRRLLIEASDFPAGSPGLKRIKERLKGNENDSLTGTQEKVRGQQREPARRR